MGHTCKRFERSLPFLRETGLNVARCDAEPRDRGRLRQAENPRVCCERRGPLVERVMLGCCQSMREDGVQTAGRRRSTVSNSTKAL